MTDTDHAWAESHIASLTPRQQRILYKALNAMGLRIGEGLDREIEALGKAETVALQEQRFWADNRRLGEMESALRAFTQASPTMSREQWYAAHEAHGERGLVATHGKYAHHVCACGCLFIGAAESENK